MAVLVIIAVQIQYHFSQLCHRYLHYVFSEDGNYFLDFTVCYKGNSDEIVDCGHFSTMEWVGNS